MLSVGKYVRVVLCQVKLRLCNPKYVPRCNEDRGRLCNGHCCINSGKVMFGRGVGCKELEWCCEISSAIIAGGVARNSGVAMDFIKKTFTIVGDNVHRLFCFVS